MTFSNLYSNDINAKHLRSKLRNNTTKAEKVLWEMIRKKKLGFKFRRQFQIGFYIVDFYCHELKLIIELDGSIHDEVFQEKHDHKRDAWLKSQEYIILRFQNNDLFNFSEKVINDITKRIDELVLQNKQISRFSPS